MVLAAQQLDEFCRQKPLLADPEQVPKTDETHQHEDRGGNPDQIAGRARSKVKKKFTVNLSLEVAEKLQRVSEDKGEKEVSTATSFIVKGVTDAYKDLE